MILNKENLSVPPSKYNHLNISGPHLMTLPRSVRLPSSSPTEGAQRPHPFPAHLNMNLAQLQARRQDLYEQLSTSHECDLSQIDRLSKRFVESPLPPGAPPSIAPLSLESVLTPILLAEKGGEPPSNYMNYRYGHVFMMYKHDWASNKAAFEVLEQSARNRAQNSPLRSSALVFLQKAINIIEYNKGEACKALNEALKRSLLWQTQTFWDSDPAGEKRANQRAPIFSAETTLIMKDCAPHFRSLIFVYSYHFRLS